MRVYFIIFILVQRFLQTRVRLYVLGYAACQCTPRIVAIYVKDASTCFQKLGDKLTSFNLTMSKVSSEYEFSNYGVLPC
jgi:ABC-type uncharacterized transport system fused permease/ATPase subunit